MKYGLTLITLLLELDITIGNILNRDSEEKNNDLVPVDLATFAFNFQNVILTTNKQQAILSFSYPVPANPQEKRRDAQPNIKFRKRDKGGISLVNEIDKIIIIINDHLGIDEQKDIFNSP